MSKLKQSLVYAASLTCSIHCIATPFLVLFSPIIAHTFNNIFIEIVLLVSGIAGGSYIIRQGYCRHKRRHSVILFITGTVFWGSHALLDHTHLINTHHNSVSSTVLLLTGTLFVLLSYYVNHRYLNCCTHADHK